MRRVEKVVIYKFLTDICLNLGMATKAKWMFMPGQHWFYARRKKADKVTALRERDGDNCWLCGHKMRFGGIPNIGKAATVEHLQPLSKGGNWKMDNLALCHLGCNKHLKNFDRAHKEKMRVSRKRD
jgi:5-methylcytosine-specific restriction endonuclease McrA